MAKEKLPLEINGKDLRLADTVRLFDDGYADAIVYNLTDTEVSLRRPYMVHADFTYTGGVITSIGLEDFKVARNAPFKVVKRGGELK